MPLALKLVTGAAAMSSLLVVLAGRDPPVPPAPVPDAIAERWPTDPPVAPKADRLPVAAAAMTLPEKIELAGPARVEPVATVAHLPATPATHHSRDICQRHGMHKVETHGGRSWRCRR